MTRMTKIGDLRGKALLITGHIVHVNGGMDMP
jgi:hypothetical protein